MLRNDYCVDDEKTYNNKKLIRRRFYLSKESLDKWDQYSAYKEEMFKRTSTEKSPWVAVDSNDKRVAKLNTLRYILNQVPYENKKTEILEVYPEVVCPIL